jgi:hypothetical protein
MLLLQETFKEKALISWEAPPPTGRSFPGTQWRAGCEQRKFSSYCAPSCLPCTMLGSGPAGRQGPRLSRFGGTGHVPAKRTFLPTSYREKRKDICTDLCNEKGQNPFALPFQLNPPGPSFYYRGRKDHDLFIKYS